jgi:hypothetical protein
MVEWGENFVFFLPTLYDDNPPLQSFQYTQREPYKSSSPRASIGLLQ